MPMTEDGNYQTPTLSQSENNTLALDLLKQFDGLTVRQIKQILKTADNMLEHLTYTDFTSDEFTMAYQQLSTLSNSNKETKTQIQQALDNATLEFVELLNKIEQK